MKKSTASKKTAPKKRITLKHFTRTIANDLLKPVLDIAEQPGVKLAIRDEINARFDTGFTLQSVQRLLDADPEKRVQPGLGLGHVLIEAGAAVKAKGKVS